MHVGPESSEWLRAEFERSLDHLPYRVDREAILQHAARIFEAMPSSRPEITPCDLFLVYVPEDRLPVAAPLAIDLVKPGATTDQIAKIWPRAEEFGFQDEMDAFGLQFGHGVGVGLHERPIISRLNSLDSPIEIQEGMVFALETYAPAADGRSAARIEEEVVVTADGCKVITIFPCEELMVANAY